MEKTKLGLSIPVVGALTHLLFLFGGYTPGLLLVGYILICESDAGLKKTAVTATLAALLFSAANMLIGLLPGVGEVFGNLVAIFDEYLDLDILHYFAAFLSSIVSLLKTFAFVALAALTLLGKPLKLSFLDDLMD